jgi:cyclic pyranopterin phosphate synthase
LREPLKISFIGVRNAAKPKRNRQQKSAWIYSRHAQTIFRGSLEFSGNGGGMFMLSHVDAQGNVMMVDVGDKRITHRTAEAEGFITMSAAALQQVREGSCAKGDVLTVAQLAGITALKRTADFIPLCHPLSVAGCKVELFPVDTGIHVRCNVRATGQTGVEMEALTGVSVALLTIYDMCKSMDKGMELSGVRLVKKTGGKSGDYTRSRSQ